MYTEEVYTNEISIEELKKDEMTMSFLKSAIDGAITTESLLKSNIVLDQPNLLEPNGFRKVKLHI